MIFLHNDKQITHNSTHYAGKREQLL